MNLNKIQTRTKKKRLDVLYGENCKDIVLYLILDWGNFFLKKKKALFSNAGKYIRKMAADQ